MMAGSRPRTAQDRSGASRPSREGPDPQLQFKLPSFDPEHPPGPGHQNMDFRPQIHQESLAYHTPNITSNASAPRRAPSGRSGPPDVLQAMPGAFPSDVGGGSGTRRPVVIQHGQLPVTRYVCFKKRPNKSIWDSGLTTCDHITMTISPEETERQIRKHDGPGRGLLDAISKLASYQQRHIRMYEVKLNETETDRRWHWVVSAVGNENPGKKTCWAIYSRVLKSQAKGSSQRPSTAKSQHTTPNVGGRGNARYSATVQPVQIPPPPRPGTYPPPPEQPKPPGAFLQQRRYTENDFMPGAFPDEFPQPQPGMTRPSADFDYASGPRIREAEPQIPGAFPQFQDQMQPSEPFRRSAIRNNQPHASFSGQDPHHYANVPGNRASMPPGGFDPHGARGRESHRPPSRSRRETPSGGQQQQYHRSSQLQQRRRRHNSVPPEYHERSGGRLEGRRGSRRSTRNEIESEGWDEDRKSRTDRWVESSISGSSGIDSTIESGNGEYVLEPPPPARRRNSLSTYGDRGYYPTSSAEIPRGRSLYEGPRGRHHQNDYYTDRHQSPPRQGGYELEYESAREHGGRRYSSRYQGGGAYVRPGRSLSRRRSGYYRDSRQDEFEYESADEMATAMQSMHINSGRDGPSRPGTYTRYLVNQGLLKYGR